MSREEQRAQFQVSMRAFLREFDAANIKLPDLEYVTAQALRGKPVSPEAVMRVLGVASRLAKQNRELRLGMMRKRPRLSTLVVNPVDPTPELTFKVGACTAGDGEVLAEVTSDDHRFPISGKLRIGPDLDLSFRKSPDKPSSAHPAEVPSSTGEGDPSPSPTSGADVVKKWRNYGGLVPTLAAAFRSIPAREWQYLEGHIDAALRRKDAEILQLREQVLELKFCTLPDDDRPIREGTQKEAAAAARKPCGDCGFDSRPSLSDSQLNLVLANVMDVTPSETSNILRSILLDVRSALDLKDGDCIVEGAKDARYRNERQAKILKEIAKAVGMEPIFPGVTTRVEHLQTIAKESQKLRVVWQEWGDGFEGRPSEFPKVKRAIWGLVAALHDAFGPIRSAHAEGSES